MAPAPMQLLKIWRNPEKSIKFSEESSRTIYELGTIELHELGQISASFQNVSKNRDVLAHDGCRRLLLLLRWGLPPFTSATSIPAWFLLCLASGGGCLY